MVDDESFGIGVHDINALVTKLLTVHSVVVTVRNIFRVAEVGQGAVFAGPPQSRKEFAPPHVQANRKCSRLKKCFKN